MIPAQTVQDRNNRPLPNAYRNMRRLDVVTALKSKEARESLTAQEYNYTLLYFDVEEYGRLSQTEIAKKMEVPRPQVQRAIANAIIKMEKKGLL